MVRWCRTPNGSSICPRASVTRSSRAREIGWTTASGCRRRRMGWRRLPVPTGASSWFAITNSSRLGRTRARSDKNTRRSPRSTASSSTTSARAARTRAARRRSSTIRRRRKVERQFLSLDRNAAQLRRGADAVGQLDHAAKKPSNCRMRQNEQRHGYNFEVPASATGPVVPVPLKAMGRFMHEAVAVEPRTSIVYQTEDRNDGLIYRFIPTTPRSAGWRRPAAGAGGARHEDTRYAKLRGDGRAEDCRGTRHSRCAGSTSTTSNGERDDLRDAWRGTRRGGLRARRGHVVRPQRGVFRLHERRPRHAWPDLQVHAEPGRRARPGRTRSPGMLQLYLEPNNSHLLESCDNVTRRAVGRPRHL